MILWLIKLRKYGPCIIRLVRLLVVRLRGGMSINLVGLVKITKLFITS